MCRIVTLTGQMLSGKTTIVKEVFSQTKVARLALSTTTREPRPSDIVLENHREYEYVTSHQFAVLNQLGRLAWAVGHGGYRYGSRKDILDQFLADGAETIGLMILVPSVVPLLRAYAPGKTFNFFINPLPLDTSLKRAHARGEDPEVVKCRLGLEKSWLEEARRIGGFHFVDNDGPLHFAVQKVFQKVMECKRTLHLT